MIVRVTATTCSRCPHRGSPALHRRRRPRRGRRAPTPRPSCETGYRPNQPVGRGVGVDRHSEYEGNASVQIKDAVAVVTGGASGLGLATTRRLLDAGASVVVIDLREGDELGKLGERVKFASADVTDEAAVGQALDLAESLGPLRINVNCAGIGSAAKTLSKDGPFPLDWFTKTIQVNLIGTFNVLR